MSEKIDVTAAKLVAYVLIAALVILGTAFVYFVHYRIKSTGNLVMLDVEVWWDSNATNPVEHIDWGEYIVGRNMTRAVNVFVTNPGDVDITLRLETENYEPLALENCSRCFWNIEGLVLRNGTGLALPTLMFFEIFANNTYRGDFAFDIICIGEH